MLGVVRSELGVQRFLLIVTCLIRSFQMNHVLVGSGGSPVVVFPFAVKKRGFFFFFLLTAV